jgi:hypothetical protein
MVLLEHYFWLKYDFYCINYYDFKNYIDSVIVRIPFFLILKEVAFFEVVDELTSPTKIH